MEWGRSSSPWTPRPALALDLVSVAGPRVCARPDFNTHEPHGHATGPKDVGLSPTTRGNFMARSNFVSFHYQNDHWRVQQILRMGALEKQEELSVQNWEAVKARGDKAVHEWIDKEMAYKNAVIVLIGSETANRKFVKYEITRAWDIKKPLLGIRIHGLEDSNGKIAVSGPDPFKQFMFKDGSGSISDYVPIFSPSGSTGKQKYADIKDNLSIWIASGYTRP